MILRYFFHANIEKLNDKTLPTTRFFVERSDMYMPVLDWLSATSALYEYVLTPVQANGGYYKVETDGDVYTLTLFLYVNGESSGVQGMTREQTEKLAKTLAHLHEAGATIPFETPGLTEDVTLPFCEQFARFLEKMGKDNDTLTSIITPHIDMLLAAVNKILLLRDTIRLGYSPLVLCHGDAHGNNVIQGERFVLADWEDLRWTPAEADLFIHAWYRHPDALIEAYANARPDFSINYELLQFYVLRRRIEDVWVDIERLTEESLHQEEVKKLLDWIPLGIEEVRAAIARLACNNTNFLHSKVLLIFECNKIK